MVNDEGIPISYSVFEGNIKDKNTVLTILEDMQQNFHIKRCIFVGDMETLPEKENFQKVKDNLFIKELAQTEKARFIACYNPIRQAATKQKRDLRLQESKDYLKNFSLARNKHGQSKKPQRVHSQIERLLRRKGTLKLFKYEYRGNADFTYSLRKDVLAVDRGSCQTWV